jgi:hypothetical protein
MSDDQSTDRIKGKLMSDERTTGLTGPKRVTVNIHQHSIPSRLILGANNSTVRSAGFSAYRPL